MRPSAAPFGMSALGGSLAPGTRFDSRHIGIDASLGIRREVNAATPISDIPRQIPAQSSNLRDLITSGVLLPALSDMDGLLYVATAAEMPKSAGDPRPRSIDQFSRRDNQVWVISEWRKAEDFKRVLSASVYDSQNQFGVTIPPKTFAVAGNKSLWIRICADAPGAWPLPDRSPLGRPTRVANLHPNLRMKVGAIPPFPTSSTPAACPASAEPPPHPVASPAPSYRYRSASSAL